MKMFPAVLAVSLVFYPGCGTHRGGTVHSSGHIEATDIRVASKVGGRLLSLEVQEGDSVHADQVVAQMDTIDILLDLARANAELQRAEAQLRLVEAGTRQEDLERAAEDVARGEAELRSAERDLARIRELADKGAVTPKALDDARTRRDIADRSVKSLQAVQARLITGARPDEVEIARAHCAAVRSVAEAAEQRLEDATVRSPSNGVVTARAAEPGEILAPGALLIVVTDLARPWLVVYLDEPSLGRVRLGDVVDVRIDGVHESLNGTLSHIASVAEFTPKNVQTPDERAKLVFKAKVTLENPYGLFKPGMPADAVFTMNE